MNPPDENPVPHHLTALRDDVAETSQVLKLTVEKLVQRGDNLDALNAQAEHLNSSSYHFQGSSRRLNRRMRNQNYKLTLFIVAAFIFVIGLILLITLHPWRK